MAVLRPRTVASDIDGAGSFSFRWLRAEQLDWSPVAALSILDGVGVQDLLITAGMLLIDGKHRPSYDPRPGADNVVLAMLELDTVPAEMTAEQLFGAIREKLS